MKERLGAVLEIQGANEELYLKTREALAKEGYTFIVPIEPVSIYQLVSRDQFVHSDPKNQRFGYVNDSESMIHIAPPQMEVAINPNNLRIENSNWKSTDDQIKMLEEEELTLMAKLPPEIKKLISMKMQNTSVLAQLSYSFMQKTGKQLFANWVGRTDDRVDCDLPIIIAVAGVGIITPDRSNNKPNIQVWRRNYGAGCLYVNKIVTLPQCR